MWSQLSLLHPNATKSPLNKVSENCSLWIIVLRKKTIPALWARVNIANSVYILDMFSYSSFNKGRQCSYILCSCRKVRTPRKIGCSLEGVYDLKMEKQYFKLPRLSFVGKYCNRHQRNCWVQFVWLFLLVGVLFFYACNHFMLEAYGSMKIVLVK